MNFRTTIILVILLLGVVAYLMFSGSGPSQAPGLHTTDAQRLLDMQSNDVSKVVLTSADGKSLVLERNTQTLSAATPAISPATSDWKITSPITAYADAMKVSDLIDGVVSATSTSQVDISTSNVADYGLDNPQFTVELEAGPKSAKVDIGRAEKTGNELYVRVEGKDVAQVIAADLLDKLDTDPAKLRLQRLVNADAATANWISIARQTDPLTLEKAGGTWQMTVGATQPTTMPVEQSVVSDLVAAISGATAVDFGDANSNPDMLIGKPRASVQISDRRPGSKSASTQPAQTETIEFGLPDSLVGKNVWVRVTPPGTLATVPKETMDSILKTPLDLRDREVVQVVSSAVSQIRVVKNRPPTTQGIPLPAILKEVVLTRRPPAPPAPAGPFLPTTNPTTGPTTLASTMPATQPVTPPSVWQITSTKTPSDADDSKVDAVLADFTPLRADKFLAAAPDSTSDTTYHVTLTIDKQPPVDVTIIDPGESSTDEPTAICGNAIFSVPRTVLTSIDTDFAKAP